MRTPLCDLLKIEVPIVQAPIGNATSPALAAAVSNAGGLGMLAMTWRDGQTIRRMIRETRSRTTRPFGVNLVLEWDVREKLQICLQEGVRIVSLFWGNPIPYIEMARRAGALIIYSAGTVHEARRAATMGADVIVAQGWESGGHIRADVATMALVPRVVDSVLNKPVIASGGIADGRGIAAALALGAQGVWIGTRFLASEEAAIHPLYKRRLLESTEADTLYATLFDIGWHNAPHRMLKNSSTEMWRNSGSPMRGRRPNEGEIIAQNADGTPILRYSDVIPLPNTRGNVEAMPMYAGQSVGLVTRVQSARVIVRQLVEETRQAIARMSGLLGTTDVQNPWGDPRQRNLGPGLPSGLPTVPGLAGNGQIEPPSIYAPDEAADDGTDNSDGNGFGNSNVNDGGAAEAEPTGISGDNGVTETAAQAEAAVHAPDTPPLKQREPEPAAPFGSTAAQPTPPAPLLDTPLKERRNGGGNGGGETKAAASAAATAHSTRFAPASDEIVSVSRDSLIHRVILPDDVAGKPSAKPTEANEDKAAAATATATATSSTDSSAVTTPTEAIPSVFDRLRLTPVLMAARISNLPRNTLTRHNNGDASIQDHVRQLLELTVICSKLMTEAVASRPIVVTEEALAALAEKPDKHETTMAQMLSRLHVERARLVRELEGRESNGITIRALHPRWRTPIRASDIAQYVAEDDEHHLTQISQILRAG